MALIVWLRLWNYPDRSARPWWWAGLTKTVGPVIGDDQLGAVDLVLTTRSGAGRLGHPAVGLAPWTSRSVSRPGGGALTVTAVPAVHGPEDGERDADGFVNCEVIGFVLSGEGLPTVYVSEGRDDLVRAFDDAGLSARLCLAEHGTWVPLAS
jgi:hypothetical protein